MRPRWDQPAWQRKAVGAVVVVAALGLVAGLTGSARATDGEPVDPPEDAYVAPIEFDLPPPVPEPGPEAGDDPGEPPVIEPDDSTIARTAYVWVTSEDAPDPDPEPSPIDPEPEPTDVELEPGPNIRRPALLEREGGL